MADKLTVLCDRVLTETLRDVELVRFARGIYAQSGDDVIWRGVWVTFNHKRRVLVTQPNVGVFCPAAEKLVSDGLKTLHGSKTGLSYFGKLRAPLLTRPLYGLVRNIIGENRLPSDYYVASAEQIDEVTKLVRDDFLRAGRRFVDPIDSLSALKDQLMVDSATGARMYAISVTYLMNKRITSNEIDAALGPQPNAMSRDFGEYFRTNFAGTSA